MAEINLIVARLARLAQGCGCWRGLAQW